MSQKQSADGGTAIQAGGDVTIYAGVQPSEMVEFMMMAAKAYNFALDAERKADERFQSFRDEMLQRFAREDGSSDSAAFRDPDFQLMLQDAQESYVRSGDEELRDTLIDIVARRSLEKNRTRMALTLNEAVKRAPALTSNELAALSLVYLVRYTIGPAGNFAQLQEYIEKSWLPFVPDLSPSSASLTYIEAQGCGSIDIGEISIRDVLSRNYEGLLTKGFTEEALTARFPQGRFAAIDALRMPCINDNEKISFNARNADQFRAEVRKKDANIQPNIITSAWGLVSESTDLQANLNRLRNGNPKIGEFFDLWNDTDLKSLKLNAVGIAIAHTNARRAVGFDASLDIWVN